MIKVYELTVPCHFGLESVTKKEITELGYEITQVQDGRVSFAGDAEAIARANIFLRTAERVLLKVGSFRAQTWEELFQGTRALPWEEFIPRNGRFWVAKASSIRSKLFSPRDIQSVMKKAMVARLGEHYGLARFPEDGPHYPLRVFLNKDEVSVYLDTSGDSLHKRGYRLKMGKAPITETLAAALIMLTPWQDGRPFVDPFCGSGTFPIEAAMIAARIAPGMNRAFTAEAWGNLVERRHWYDAVEEAEEQIDRSLLETRTNAYGRRVDIQGYDIDPEIVAVARENAERAGVGGLIHFQAREVARLSHPKPYGFIVTNPPYGERIEDKRNLPLLYTELGEAWAGLDNWSMYVITAWDEAERWLGRRADKNRKIYNGMMKTYFYSYLGAKPPRRDAAKEDTASDFRGQL